MPRSGGCESVEHGWVFGRWGAYAKLVQDAHESLETAVHSHDFADARRGRREIRQMGQRVEQWQRRRRVQRYPNKLAKNAEKKGGIMNVPRRSYSCEVMQTHALFCAGNAKLDSRIA